MRVNRDIIEDVLKTAVTRLERGCGRGNAEQEPSEDTFNRKTWKLGAEKHRQM